MRGRFVRHSGDRLANRPRRAPGRSAVFDGIVDAADYAVWRDGLGSRFEQAHLAIWKANFGATANSGATAAVPEPTALLLMLIACGVIAVKRRLPTV